ncbi:urease accessory protein UreJ [Comamonas serinivorans]|uniref:Urease accessory protein UreJ n=1 Tax=Comamonas serinivorans TaxID=1082851 RepID=A0A1Y0EJN6_9BURK|nr:HupE/UreJ family protein [Comamonas serinivorans]ARU03579.1 urease accessory protein UreJ [Comamonas serinivorans]
MRFARFVLPVLATAAWPVWAHTGADAGAHHHGFMAGALHPLMGLDHLVAMLAVGLWSGLAARPGREVLVAPLGFAAMLLVGAGVGLAGIALPAVEPLIAASLLVLGLLVGAQQRLPVWASVALMGGFALCHGVAHGYELAGEAAAVPTLAGMLLATLALHGTGIGLAGVLRRVHRGVPRAAGWMVALLGVALLGGAA